MHGVHNYVADENNFIFDSSQTCNSWNIDKL